MAEFSDLLSLEKHFTDDESKEESVSEPAMKEIAPESAMKESVSESTMKEDESEEARVPESSMKHNTSSSSGGSFILAAESWYLEELAINYMNNDPKGHFHNTRQLYCQLKREKQNLKLQLETAKNEVAEKEIEKDEAIALCQNILITEILISPKGNSAAETELEDMHEQGSPTQILPGGINYNNGNGSASALNLTRSSSCLNLSNQEYIADSCDSFTDTVADVNVMPENSKISGKSDEDNVDISTKSSVQSDKHSSSNSSQDSFIQEIDSVLLEAKIAKLELENQDNSKQILNMQHLYAELRNENANLQFQIDRANKQVAEAQIEKDQYIARAHRILLEKEKLISLKQENNSIEEAQNIFATYNEELKKELEFHQRRNEELVNKNKQLAKEIQSLQKNHQVILNGFQLTNEKLEQKLANEMRFRSTAEEDCLQTNKELFVRNQENLQLRELLRARDDEILSLKETIKQKTNAATNEGVESTIKSLTETLMLKQNNLETVTTERNALRLQLEKLETDYRNNLIQMNRSQTRAVHMEEPDESVPLPRFMRVSPFDAGVTRRVKHAYSTLDAVSIRTGVFLRRYPVARVFVFCYMVLLHIWVFILLFQYVPQTSH